MATLYGGVYDYGFGLATSPEEVKCLMQSGKKTEIVPFTDEMQAYDYLRFSFIYRGFRNLHRLLPLPGYDGFQKYRFYKYAPGANIGQGRFFAVFNDQIFAVIDSAEIAAAALFAPNTALFLQEYESKDEALDRIYLYYGVKGGVQVPYCNGAPLPVLSSVIKLNVFYPSPLVKYFKDNLRLPENLQRLGPYYSGNQYFFNCILLK
jgi:hypothetical protein